MHGLAEWDSFYVILGSAAGALIGLQFVVMTLLAEQPSRQAAEGSATFATPTIIYFSVSLLVCALMRVPWAARWQLTTVYWVIGLGGLVYVADVFRRMITQRAYQPEAEDWIFHALLPFIAFGTMVMAAVAQGSRPPAALFSVAASVLMLLFIGIHNAWDAVVYHVVQRSRKKPH